MVRVNGAELFFTNLNKMRALVQKIKKNVRKLLRYVVTKMEKTYNDTDDAVTWKIKEDLLQKWKKKMIYFQV